MEEGLSLCVALQFYHLYNFSQSHHILLENYNIFYIRFQSFSKLFWINLKYLIITLVNF